MKVNSRTTDGVNWLAPFSFANGKYKVSFCSKTYLTSLFKIPGDLQNCRRFGRVTKRNPSELYEKPLLSVISYVVGNSPQRNNGLDDLYVRNR